MEEECAESRREPKERRKRKRLDLRMEALPESSNRIPPVVGYFPSCFDPTEEDGGDADVRLFRNRLRANRLEVIVSPKDSNVDYVGTNYSGEAAGPQLCTYALGVLDKETGTLKIAPIAANKIFRLEMKATKKPSKDAESLVASTQESAATEKASRKVSDLMSLYGTKKHKAKLNKWRLVNEESLPADQEYLGTQMLNDEEKKEALEDANKVVARNIPPHDSSAVSPLKAYPLDEIILKEERSYLLDILEIVHSGADFASETKFWQDNGYPSFVFNRIHRLREIKDEEAMNNLACMLSSITHLLNFMDLASKFRNSKSLFQDSSTGLHNIPQIVRQKLLRMFLDNNSVVLSTEKRELLIGYILVLTLHVDKFQTDPSDISKDLKMPYSNLKPYYLQLGCKETRNILEKKSVLSLPLPLNFPELKKPRRRG